MTTYFADVWHLLSSSWEVYGVLFLIARSLRLFSKRALRVAMAK